MHKFFCNINWIQSKGPLANEEEVLNSNVVHLGNNEEARVNHKDKNFSSGYSLGLCIIISFLKLFLLSQNKGRKIKYSLSNQ